MNKENPSRMQVEDLVSGVLRRKINSIKSINREGGDSCIFFVTTDSGEYYLRTGGKRQNYDVEHRILGILREAGVKVPKPIAASVNIKKYGFSFSLQEKIPGKNMYETKPKLWPFLLKEVGKQLSLVYETKLPGFGAVDLEIFRKKGKLVGSQESWFKFVEKRFVNKFDSVVQKVNKEKVENFVNTNLTKSQLCQLLEIVDRYDEIKENITLMTKNQERPSGLIHGDLHFDHFIVKNGNLEGILDFNKTFIGDPLYDIAYFSVMPHGDLYRYLLKESGISINKDLFGIYRLLIAAGKIHVRYVQHDYLNRYPRILDVAIDELNK